MLFSFKVLSMAIINSLLVSLSKSKWLIQYFRTKSIELSPNLVNQIARFQKAIVVTRENNRESIEQYIKENNVLFGKILEIK